MGRYQTTLFVEFCSEKIGPRTIKLAFILYVSYLSVNKSEISKISKVILEQLNSNILNATGYQQWRSTKSVIKWFNSIPNKNTCHFLKFNVVEFYPSIGENLLNQALNFAKTFQAIAPEQIKIIQHCRKSLLFDDSSSWVKR